METLIYNGDKEFLVLYPVDLLVSKGTEYTPKNEDEKERFLDLGFEVKNIKKKKEGDK